MAQPNHKLKNTNELLNVKGLYSSFPEKPMAQPNHKLKNTNELLNVIFASNHLVRRKGGYETIATILGSTKGLHIPHVI